MMTEWLPMFVLGIVLMEAGMGRAKGATHCFVKGLVTFAVGALIGAVGNDLRGALLTGATATLATIGLGDRVTLSAAAALAAGIAIVHRMFATFDRFIGATMALPEPLTALQGMQRWLASNWLMDYGGVWSVHALAGGAALGALMAVGPRIGRYTRNGAPAAMPAHNLPMAGMGTVALWAGLQAFSAPLWWAASYSAFSALLAALLWTRWRFGKTDPSFAFTAFWAGSVAGLASSVPLAASIVTGALAGVVAVAVSLRLDKRFVDDPVGVVAAEGVAPLLGLIAQWVWRTAPLGSGLVCWTGAFGVGFAVARLVGRLLWWLGALRPAPADELAGVDQRLYGIAAYPEFELREA